MAVALSATNILTNTVDGGSGDDHVTAHAETEFQCVSLRIASNLLFGGSGNDVLDATAMGRSNATRDTIQMSFTVAQATMYCTLST